MQLQDIPIMMYHSISYQANRKFKRFTVSPDLFARHIAYLHEREYVPITVGHAVRALSGGEAALPERPVVLTFDDGFADFYTAAFPVLERYEFAATLYIATAFIGGTSRWMRSEGETERPMLTWDQLAEVTARGIECGAHSHSHPHLDLLSPSMAREEITRCKEILEDRLARPISTFAYPFGHHTTTVRRIVRSVGYTSACAVRSVRVTGVDDPFVLARRTVMAGTGVDGFVALLSRRRFSPAALVEPGRALAWRAIQWSAAR
jgi:peptidoglycan/xylan/chitin deacetylase (PgdA/CDA1 family)